MYTYKHIIFDGDLARTPDFFTYIPSHHQVKKGSISLTRMGSKNKLVEGVDYLVAQVPLENNTTRLVFSLTDSGKETMAFGSNFSLVLETEDS